MGKSIRCKSRQRTLSTRRKKFRERERLKAWDHYNRINAAKETQMETQQEEDSTSIVDTELKKIPKKEVTKWGSRNSRKRQKQRLKAQARVNTRRKHKQVKKKHKSPEKME